MTIQRKKLGRQGEDAAACYLEKNGYTLLRRNYTCRLGEIDIVAMDRDVLVLWKCAPVAVKITAWPRKASRCARS